MRDRVTESESSVFEAAADAGMVPGDDEKIFATLRKLFPDAPSDSIRFITHLPPESALSGWVNGTTVYFLKSYQGDHIGGYKVGDDVVGYRHPSHSVHYKGRLSPDCLEIEGKWWIDPMPELGVQRRGLVQPSPARRRVGVIRTATSSLLIIGDRPLMFILAGSTGPWDDGPRRYTRPRPPRSIGRPSPLLLP